MVFVQDFVRSPHFTQKSFFSESGLRLLSESVPIADSITLSSVHAPWSHVETACAGQVVSDMRNLWDRNILRRRTARDTSERWYLGGIPRDETSSRPGVRFFDIVEEGRVEYVPAILLHLFLVLLGLARFVLPQQAEEKDLSKPREDASEI